MVYLKGHIFRDRSPYKWMPGVNVLRKNSVRLADVWLDEYKKIYFDRINNELVREDLLLKPNFKNLKRIN
jgi:hypothetical protein